MHHRLTIINDIFNLAAFCVQVMMNQSKSLSLGVKNMSSEGGLWIAISLLAPGWPVMRFSHFSDVCSVKTSRFLDANFVVRSSLRGFRLVNSRITLTWGDRLRLDEVCNLYLVINSASLISSPTRSFDPRNIMAAYNFVWVQKIGR